MKSFELTDRGKITIAAFVVIVLLIISIILALVTFATNSPEEPPPEPSTGENRETVTHPGLSEIQEPPDSGGFPPPSVDGDVSDSSSDDIISDDTSQEDSHDYSNGEESGENGDTDTQDSLSTPHTPSISNPSLNFSTGELSFLFFPHLHTALDRETTNLLNTFLNLPDNTPDSTVAIQTPVLSSDDSEHFMAIMKAALVERNINSGQISHLVNPEMPQDEHFEVTMFFITREIK